MTDTLNRSQATALTAREKADLSDLFGAFPAVQAAYVFGSAATGRRSTRSDLDLAVWLHDTAESASLRLDLLTELIRRGFDDVDLVVLNEADLTLQYEALRPNVLIYATDDFDHPATFSNILRKYWDFEPYLAAQRAAYKNELQHG